MKPKTGKSKSPRKTPGTVLGEQMLAEGNKLSDAEREKSGDEFMKLYYGGKFESAPARRR